MPIPDQPTQPVRNQSLGARVLRALGIVALLGGLAGHAVADDPEPTPADDAPPAPGELVRQARERLSEYRTIETDLVQTSYFGRRRFEARGRYVQAEDHKLRLEYEVRVGRTPGRLLQVCDGVELSTERTIGEETRVTIRKLRPILEAARRTGLSGERLMITELGLGGLPAMIAAIEQSTTFEEVEVDDSGETRLYVVKGRWSEAARSRMQASPEAPLIAPYVPDRVELYLDERRFPRLIRYVRSAGGEGALARGDNVIERLVTIEFRNTTLNGEVDEDLFEYSAPKGVFLNEVTEEYIRKIQEASAPPSGSPTAPSN